jgi:hypothetical protein
MDLSNVDIESLPSLYLLISPSRFVFVLLYFLGWIVLDALTDYKYEDF